MSDLSHKGFQYKYFLYYQANLCSVPQAKSPSLRILGLYSSDEEVISELERLRADVRVNRLPIMIGSCHKRGIVGLSLSRSIHGIVVQDKVRDVFAASKAFTEEREKAKYRKRDQTQLEYGMTYDYVNRVLRTYNEMRSRMGKPSGWSTRYIFSFLMHNATAPDVSFDRTKMREKLYELLAYRSSEGKRVWQLGDESAKSLEEIDWERTVAKQLEHMQSDLESNFERDETLEYAVREWPRDLYKPDQEIAYIHILYDLTEEGLSWLDSMALGREPAYTVMGTSSLADENFTNDYVRDSLLNKLDTPGQGIMAINMYEWFDFSNTFSAKTRSIYNDEKTQQYYDTMVHSQKMSQLIETKAREKNAAIKTITNEDMLDQLKEAAERGDSVVPQLTTQVSLEPKQDEEKKSE